MDIQVSGKQEPERDISSAQLVRNIFAFLASRHPNISPDDVAHLPDDLIDWDKLVRTDFPREWQVSTDEMLLDSCDIIRKAGKFRDDFGAKLNTLGRLLEEAKGNTELATRVFGDLQCAALLIGELIADEVRNTHSELAEIVRRQANAFWNASANKAMAEAEFNGAKIVLNLPEGFPRAPELNDE